MVFKNSNSMSLNLILFSQYEKRDTDIFLLLWDYNLLFTQYQIKRFDRLSSQAKTALHILVVENEFLKALRHLSVIPPTSTYAQVHLLTVI